MSVTVHYHDLLAAAAVRCNALFGTDPVELQVTYATRPLTNELFDSSIFPMNAIRDAILNAEQRYATTVALSTNRTLRTFLRSTTDALPSGNPLPKFDATGNSIIGNFGAVLDGVDESTVLTRKPVALVRNRLLSPLLFLAPAYYFALDGVRLLHTRETVVLECCVYNAETQRDAFDADDTMLFPDNTAETLIQGALGMLVRDDEWVQQAQLYAGYFSTALAALPPAAGEEMAT